jgi:hypothetical protein
MLVLSIVASAVEETSLPLLYAEMIWISEWREYGS